MADKTIVALYDDFAAAVHAVRALEDAGFQHEDLNLVANNAENRWRDPQAARAAAATNATTHAAGGAEAGATVGAVAGGAAGLLASLGVLAIPGVGPVLAAGPIVALIAGAGVGAAAGGLIGGLVGLGVPEEEAHAYAEGVRRGGALVTARVAAGQAERAVDILEQHEAIDVEERQAGWRDGGWRRFDDRAEPWTVKSIEGERMQRPGARATTGVGFGETMRGSRSVAEADAPDAPTTPSTASADQRKTAEAASAAAPRKSAGTPASDVGAELRSGIIHRESDTARIAGGPVSSAMSGMAGSPESLREQEEPLKRHGDMARPRVRSYGSEGASPGERVDRAMDGAATGDKPMHADDPDRYGGDDNRADRK